MAQALKVNIDELVDLHFNKKITINNISKTYNCDPQTIRNILHRNGYKGKTNNELLSDNICENSDVIIKLYRDEYKDVEEIGEMFNVSGDCIRKFLQNNNIYMRTSSETRMLKRNFNINDIVDLYYNKLMTASQIAEIYNYSTGGITWILKKCGYKLRNTSEMNKNNSYLNQEIENIVKLYYIDMKNAKQIGEIYNCCGTNIQKVLNNHGYELRCNSASKMNNTGFQLDRDVVEDLYYVKHNSIAEIAKKFHCSNCAVSKFLKRNKHKLRNWSEASKISKNNQLLNDEQKIIIRMLFELGWKHNSISSRMKISSTIVSPYFSMLLKEKYDSSIKLREYYNARKRNAYKNKINIKSNEIKIITRRFNGELQQYLDNIIKLYYIDKKSCNQISVIYNCKPKLIQELLKRNGYILRNGSSSKFKNVGLELDIEQIKIMYCDKKLDPTEIGNIVGCNATTITRYLKDNGVKLRNISQAMMVKTEFNLDIVIDLYYNKLYSLRKIAKLCKCSAGKISSILKLNKFTIRTYKETILLRRSIKNEL